MDHNLRMISPLDRAFHLKRLAGLRDIPPADLAHLALLAHEHSFARGSSIYEKGKRVDEVHIVVQGRVRVRGGEYADHVVDAPNSIGMLSLLARDDKGLDAVAETETITIALKADDLFDAFEDDFAILYSLIRELATQTLQLRRQIPEGTYLAPAEEFGEAPPGGGNLVERILYMRRGGFSESNIDAMMGMALRMKTINVDPGTKLWSVGAPSGFLYSIISGRVRCTTEDGTQFLCGPGYPLGNLESQCGAKRWYTAVSETEVTALRSETDAFLDAIEQHFEMALFFVAAMASGLIARRAEMRSESKITTKG